MRRSNIIFTGLLLFAIAMLFACHDNMPDQENPDGLTEDEFKFIPDIPIATKEVSMIFYGCGYYETSSVTRDQNTITVKKRFNGAMKRPCILELDTIPLGFLEPGNYEVILNIIDINPFATDSLFLSETKSLVVYE